MMKKLFRTICISATLCAASIASTQANIVFQDGFESDTVAVPTTTLTNWNVVSGPNVDVVGPSSFGFLCNNNLGGNCLDMDGSSSNGSITTKLGLNLLAGMYTFSFDYGNNGSSTNTLDWSVGSFEVGSVTTNGANANNYTTYTSSFNVAADTANVFINFTGGGSVNSQGTVLDNVMLSFVAEPVSAPTSIALLGLGLLALGYKSRKA